MGGVGGGSGGQGGCDRRIEGFVKIPKTIFFFGGGGVGGLVGGGSGGRVGGRVGGVRIWGVKVDVNEELKFL